MSTSFYGRSRDARNRSRNESIAVRSSSANGGLQQATPTRRTSLQDRSNNAETYQPGMYLRDMEALAVDSDCSSGGGGDGLEVNDFDFGDMSGSPAELSTAFNTPRTSTPRTSTPRTGTPRSNVSYDVQMPHQGDNQVVALLQQQQFMIKNVLDGQKQLQKKQENLEVRLQELETKVNKPADLTPPSSGSDQKRKRIVTRTLSVKVLNCM